MLTQVGVKQLTDFLRTVTAASYLVDCTLVNCEYSKSEICNLRTLFKKPNLDNCKKNEGGGVI